MIDYSAVFSNYSGAFPDILAVNVSAPGAGDGTEFIAALVNDVWGRAQALMDRANLTPDGVTEAAGTAQIIEAISKGFGVGAGCGVIYWKNDTPAVHGDRVLLLQGQVIAIASYADLVAATYCGDANNATAPAFYKTSDSGGTTRSTSGTYFVLPDARGLSLKMLGNATINTRTKTGPTNLGEMQEDQFQGHYHDAYMSNSGGAGQCLATTSAGTVPATIQAQGTAIRGEITDGANGTPRTGTNTRDSSMGTNFGVGY